MTYDPNIAPIPQWARWIEPVTERRAAAVLRRLLGQYSEPWRFYHDLSHIERMFLTWDAVSGEVRVEDTDALTLAIWFHDAVYDPRRTDNEVKSAEEACAQLKDYPLGGATLSRLERMILATATHQIEGADSDTELLLDLDLAILGAHESDYETYAAAIRREYGHVPEEAYRAGRIRVLRRFVERPRIYLAAPLAARFEEQARRNLAREIEALQSGT